MLCVKHILYFLISGFWFLNSALPARAGLIRDAEIEHTLRVFADPIFKTAGLKPEAIHIFIIQDDSINAFVAGGQNVFINTGLIEACTNPGMLLGVIAHETGHIVDGHIARGAEMFENATLGMILTYVLGAAAAIGNADAGMAVMAGGNQVVNRLMLSYSRGNEQAADQSALTTLDKLGISASGMVDMFNLLHRDELRSFGTPDPYALTHPLSTDRIEHVRAHVEESSIPPGTWPKGDDMLLQRTRAKLYAFLQMPPETFARYPETDKSIPARMARAIAWYKIPEMDKAAALMHGLIAEHPNDPFFYDLLGQMMFENDRIPEALAAYRKAAALLPSSGLILTALGQTEVAAGQDAAAVQTLEKARLLDNTNPETWQFLSIAYGRKGNQGMASLALAEEAMLDDDAQRAAMEAKLALQTLTDHAARLRAEDIKNQAEQMKKEKKNS